jgi:RNA polymerase sigma-70 factor
VAPDPELAYLKARYAREFRQAFAATLAGLSTDDANLLRLYYIEEMSSQAIAQLRGVSARSVQRWLDAARQRIVDETRALLRSELAVSDTEMDSLLGLVQSQLDVSICEALRREA